MRLALRAREVQVPDLTNRTANEATAVAGDAGPEPFRSTTARRPDPKIAAGRVLAQEPAAGATPRQPAQRPGLAERRARAPRRSRRSTGETERAAQLRLAQDGLDAGRAWRRSDRQTYPSDVVVAQDPAAEDAGRRASRCSSTAASTARATSCPISSASTATARPRSCARHGFRVAVVGSTPYPGVAAGIVLRQSPQAGFQIAPGEPISLEVSR